MTSEEQQHKRSLMMDYLILGPIYLELDGCILEIWRWLYAPTSLTLSCKSSCENGTSFCHVAVIR